MWKVSVFGAFMVRIFSDLDWIRRHTEYVPVFSPNAGKFWPEKLWIRTLFTECYLYLKIFCLLFFFLLQALNDLFLYIVNRIIYFFKKNENPLWSLEKIMERYYFYGNSDHYNWYWDFVNYVNHDKIEIWKCIKLLQHF